MSVDCKELIERLRDLAVYTRDEYNETAVEDAMFDAADTIETLLAEREAAMEDLRGRCDICNHRRVCLFDEQHRIGCANSKRGHWQWRGPKQHDRQQTEAENETK